MFYAVRSSDPNEARRAQETIQSNYSNPQFIVWIVEQFQKPDQPPQFLEVLCIVLVDIMRHYSKSADAWQSMGDWSPIKQALICLLGSISDPLKPHITESIRLIFTVEDVAATDVMDGLLGLLKESPSKSTVTQIMSLFAKWAERVSTIQKDHVNRCDPFVVQYCQIVGALLPACDMADPTSFEVITHVATSLRLLLRGATESLGGDAVLSLFAFLANALEVQSNDDRAATMKAGIWKMFTEANKQKPVEGAQDVHPARVAFFEAYGSELRLKVTAEIANVLRRCPEKRTAAVDDMLAAMLGYVRQIILKDKTGSDPARQAIVTPEFVVNVLLPCARLTQTDIELFRDMPEQFIGFCMSKGEDMLELMVRNVCAVIAAALGSIVDLSPILLGCMNTPLDTEAALFLIAHCHDGKPMNPELYARLWSMVPEVMSNALVLAPSLLLALRNDSMNADAAREMSFEFLTKCNNQVVQIESLKLLDKAFEQSNSLGSIDPCALLNSVMALAQSIHDESIGVFISNLMVQFHEQFLPHAQELLQWTLATLTDGMQSEVTDSAEVTALSELLGSCVAIVESMPQEQIPNIVVMVAEFVTREIAKFPDAGYVPDIIDLAAACFRKVSEPFPGMVELITVVVQLWVNVQDLEYMLDKFAMVVCPLLRFNLAAEVVSMIVDCVNNVISRPHQEEGVVATGLAIISCIIQNGGPIELAQMACTAMANPEQTGQIVVGAVFVFAAALQVTNGEFAQMITPDVLGLWTEMIEMGMFSTYRSARVCLIALSWLIKRGNGELVEPALGIAQFAGKKREEEKEDVKGMETEEEDYFDDEELREVIPPSVSMPLDSVNEFQVFVAALQESGVWRSLPEDAKGYLMSACQ